ncbi:MAG: hypothetical protein WD009_07335 [Phycisphaeraceae bacterium]
MIACRVLALVCATCVAWALGTSTVVAGAGADVDRLHLRDGRTFEGEILTEDTQYVRFNAHIDGVEVRLTVSHDDIRNLERTRPATLTTPATSPTTPAIDDRDADADAPATFDLTPGDAVAGDMTGPAYSVLPLRGDIGLGVQARGFAEALAIARAARPQVVILPITSDGGMVRELDALLALIAQWRRETGIPLVALVEERAYSAAAILAAACDHVYMTPGSVIGSAMAIEADEQKQQWRAVDEKFASAYRARSRAAAEQAGRDGRLIEAMIDPAVALTYSADEQGRVEIHRVDGGAEPGAEARGPQEFLVGADRLLTLTADEAVRVGLAEAVVDDLAGVLARHELTAGHDASPRARQVLESQHQEVVRSMQHYERLTAEVVNQVELLERQVAGERAGTSMRAQYLRGLNRLQRSLEQVDRLARRYPWIATRVEHEYEVPPADIAEQTQQAIDRLR